MPCQIPYFERTLYTYLYNMYSPKGTERNIPSTNLPYDDGVYNIIV